MRSVVPHKGRGQKTQQKERSNCVIASYLCHARSLLVIVMIYVYLLTADIDKLKEGEEMSEEESTKAQMEMAE